jgi:hypothetical protein
LQLKKNQPISDKKIETSKFEFAVFFIIPEAQGQRFEYG